MENSQSYYLPEHIEIPKVFYSDSTGHPFEHCIHCNGYILGENTHYVVEKVIKNYKELQTTDTIFEYAICVNCYQELRKSISAESMTNLGVYMQKNADLEQRRRSFIESGNLKVEDWISSCIFKKKLIRDCSEYQIMCECIGGQMLFTMMPYMVCDEAMDDMMNLLSEKTQGFFDDFRERFLGPSPEVSELLRPKRVLLL